MKKSTGLEEMRSKEAKTLLTELEREKIALARDRIALKLGKLSKTHTVVARKKTIARLLTVLGEKVRGKL